jgi:hypothetical protein
MPTTSDSCQSVEKASMRAIFWIALLVKDPHSVAALERGERHGDLRVDDMQAIIARRKAKHRKVRAGPGSGGSHRLHPDDCAIRAKSGVNERRAMHDQVESKEQAQRTR